MIPAKVKASDRWIEVAASLFAFVILYGKYVSAMMTCTSGSPIVSLTVLLCHGCYMMGCFAYCEGKGYHGAWGLLGTVYVVGMIPLVLLPDKRKQRP